MKSNIKIGRKKVDPRVNRTSDRVGDLIYDGITERVYKSTIKNPKIKI